MCSTKDNNYWPAIKQGKRAGMSSGHPSGWLGNRFSPLTASRPKTKKKTCRNKTNLYILKYAHTVSSVLQLIL